MSSYNRKTLLKIYKTLLKNFGDQKWWPADSPFEVMLGAILTQNTNWGNVEKAINNIKKAGLMDPRRLYQLSDARLQKLIRPTGYFRQKAKKIKVFFIYFIGKYNADIKRMKKELTAKLRQELLSIWGIGPETADSILLYALDKKSFVVDAYTMRFLNRFKKFGHFGHNDYMKAKAFFEENLPASVKLYNEFHALIVALGKDYCRKINSCCEECPLADLGCWGAP